MIFKLTHRNGSWIFSPLYSFPGRRRWGPALVGRVSIGPNGTIYGTTAQGGGTGCYGEGCGTVFNLRPPALELQDRDLSVDGDRSASVWGCRQR